MKVLVIGSTGRLGQDVCNVLKSRGIEHCGIGSAALDITDRDAVMDFIQNKYPCDVVVLTAALCSMEKIAADLERAYLVNSNGPKWVAQACSSIHAKMLFISTDYVFDGEAGRPYTEDDIPNAINDYGKSKILAEKYIKENLSEYFILRVAWLFSNAGGEYLEKVVKAVQKGDPFPAILERIACPTYTEDIAERICEFIMTEKYGTYHVVNEGCCTQEQFCELVQELMGKHIELLPQQLPDNAVPYPKNTCLSTEKMQKAGFTAMEPWQSAVERCLRKRGIID